MNQIIFKQEKEVEEIKKKENNKRTIKIISLILIGIILIGCLIFGIMVYLTMNKPIFIPEETKLDIYIHQNNIIVEAYNSQGLESMFFKLEGGNNFSVYPEDEHKDKLNAIVPISKGSNIIYIEVIDSNGNRKVKEQKIIGVTEAKINITVEDGYYLINVTDEEKIKSIEYEFNGMSYSLNAGEVKEFSFKQKLDYGKNIIKVKVLNSNEVYSTKEMEYQFN